MVPLFSLMCFQLALKSQIDQWSMKGAYCSKKYNSANTHSEKILLKFQSKFMCMYA